MRTSDFDFDLPEELIAQVPLPHRDASRLLCLPRAGGAPVHARFSDLPAWLRAGDLLVLNDTKVLKARLRGIKEASGGRVEVLLCDPLPPREGRPRWRCMAGASKPLRPGLWLRFGAGEEALRAQVDEVAGDGFVDLAFEWEGERLLEAVERLGEIPLPPYMRRAPDAVDADRYQTIYAREAGAVAAPTAGLHFTEATFAALRERGVQTRNLTLHVGPGTFLPVRSEDIREHRMHEERYFIPPETVEAIKATRRTGGRVIAVGTTSLRALESAAADGSISPGPGVSSLFIHPGHSFRAVDGLLTNFHLPRSTLVMLVAALVGRERLLSAYEEAVRLRYRFYSYGDAMLIL